MIIVQWEVIKIITLIIIIIKTLISIIVIQVTIIVSSTQDRRLSQSLGKLLQ